MTSHRLMDGVDGRPGGGTGTPLPTDTGNTSPYVAGLVFEVTEGGCFFEGYWWYIISGMSTTAKKCALWNVNIDSENNDLSAVVANSVITSGTLSTGWNYIPLSEPIPLAINTTYEAAIGVNGVFPLTQNQFGSGDPYEAGITSGPLFAFSDFSGSAHDPYKTPQGPFSVAGTDPSTSRPGEGDASDILWLDVQVRDDTPETFAGPYNLWPNKTDASNGTTGDASKTFVLSTEIHALDNCNAQAIRFYSNPDTATSLPTWAGIYSADNQSLVVENTSPTWTLLDGVTAASAGQGWVRTVITTTALTAGSKYKAAVYNANGAGGSWSPTQYGYWVDADKAPNGITWGPLYAPPAADATDAYVYYENATSTPPYTDGSTQEPSQGTFANTGPQYPYLAVDYNVNPAVPAGAVSESFWVDMEVMPATSTETGAVSMSGSGSFVLGPNRVFDPSLSMSGSGSFSAEGTGSYNRGLIMQGSGNLSIATIGTRFSALNFSGSGAFAASGHDVTQMGAVSFSGSGSFIAGATGPRDTRTALQLGGTFLDANNLGGTVTRLPLGGNLVETNVLGGTAAVPDVFDGTLVEWTMQEVDISLAEFNDDTLNLSLTSSGSAYDITGLELDMYLKAKAGDADNAGTTVKLSTTTGEITITNAAQGQATVAIPNADLQASSFTFYRVDVVADSKKNTAIYGKVSTTLL